MKIDSLASAIKVNLTSNQQIAELNLNSEFSAKVLNVDDNKAILKLADGKLLEAVISGNLKMNIGDFLDLKVKNSENGKIELKVVDMKDNTENRSDTHTDTRIENLKTSLMDIQELPNEKNIQIAQELVKNNLQVNKDNIKMLSSIANTFGESKIKDAVFLVSNGLKVNEDNLKLISQINENRIELADNLQTLKNLIIDISKNQPDLSDKINQIINEKFGQQVQIKSENIVNEQNKQDDTKMQHNINLYQNLKEEIIEEHIDVKNQAVTQNNAEMGKLISLNDNAGTESITIKIDNDLNNIIKILNNNLNTNIEENKSLKLNLNSYKQGKTDASSDISTKNIISSKVINNVDSKNVLDSKNSVNNISKNDNINNVDNKKYAVEKLINKGILDVENLNGADIKNLNNDIKDITKTLSDINKTISSYNISQEIKDTFNNIVTNISNTTQFLDSINQNYVQMFIPLNNNGDITTGQLYIMKNNKKIKSKKETSTLNIYFVLDTSNMGIVKINMNCTGKNLNINFKVDGKIAVKNINAKSSELIESLKECNYNVDSLKVDMEKEKTENKQSNIARIMTAELQEHFDFKV